MKKSVLSMILAFFLLIGMDTSVQAINLDISESLPAEECIANDFSGREKSDTLAVHDADLYIKKLTMRPVMSLFDADGTFVSNYIPDEVYKTVIFSANTTGLSQFGNISLTTAQTQKIYSEARNAAKSDPSINGLTSAPSGWYIECDYQCVAKKPQYILASPYVNHMYGESQRLDITSQSAVVTLRCMVPFPNNDSTVRCQAGIDGAFYFVYTTGSNSGKLGSAALTASITTNSDAS